MIRLNTNLANFLAGHGSLRQALRGGEGRIYSGPQPASADAAPTGTLLAVITSDGAVRTPEASASTTFTVPADVTSITSVQVGGVEICGAVALTAAMSRAEAAAAVATAINDYVSEAAGEFIAATSSDSVVIYGLPGTGAAHNGKAVAVTVNGTAITPPAMAGGADSANGLQYAPAVGGVVNRRASSNWSGVGLASGTAGWFRWTGAAADLNSANPANPLVFRLDGSIGTSGADMIGASTSIVEAAPQTFNAASFYIPQV